ncbi:MAG: FISUMP domain-containing protein [Candidatus Falkowbacteria bacterium]
MKIYKKAFTLIELLVVIAIIGILATISVLALSNARAKSRDAKRVGDVKQVQTALELFFNDNNRYPTIEEWNTGKIYSTTTDATSTYMQVIPTAPTPADGSCSDGQNVIGYIPALDGSAYSISFCLGNTTGTLAPGPKCLTPGGILDINCGSFSLNYIAGPNGSITGTLSQTVDYGDSGLAVTAVPDAGYYFVNWSDSSTDNPRVDINISENILVTANFATTPFSCGTDQVIIASIAGHNCNTGAPYYDKCTYDTVQIGTQCWMKQNMNIGSMVTGVTNQTSNSALEKYCYSNTLGNCQTYGGLYQCDEAMQYSIIERSQGICPAGWHIPSDAEQYTLEQYLTDPPNTCNPSRISGWLDCVGAGTKLRTGGSSGFEALLTGYRGVDGSFNVLGVNAFFWPSNVGSPNFIYRTMNPGYTTVSRHETDRANGLSIRCLQD